VTPLQPQEAGPPPSDIGAAQAAPKPKPEAEVAAPFQGGSQELDQQMAEAQVTDDQLAKSNEPQFQSALQAKQVAQADAAQAPLAYRQQEQAVLSQAQVDAGATVQTQLAAMHGDRTALLAQVAGVQGETKSKDEEERAKVATHIQGIYEKTKTQVEARLASLDTEVQNTFDRGAEAARKAFEDYVNTRMETYKEERYSGVLGWGHWLKDELTDMPSEVNQFYVEGRNLYIARMDAVIDQVVGVVETGLATAKAIIAQGRQEIQEYVANLPASLQQVGQEAASNIQGQFSELEQSVNDKQNELVDTLAQKYNESLQQVDARIEQLKAANRGLVSKARDAVVRVVKTILQLKDMLLNVLGKAASVITSILKDPIGFVGNLVTAVKQGLDNFVSKIGDYLKQGLIQWLTGAIASTGIQLPDTWDLKGIFSLVMQILGLTYDAIRATAVKVLGEKVVSVLEQTFEIFKILATEGIAGLWNFVQDKVGDLKAMVMDQIQDMLITQVIKAGIKWIIGLLNPAAAFIKACIAIYDIIQFFITRGREVIELVNSIIGSVGAIVAGNLSGAAQLVEQSLGKAVPTVIGFLASLLGLGNIGEKVQAIFQMVRKPIQKAIGWVLAQAKKFAKKLGAKLGFGKGEAIEGEERDPEHDKQVKAGLAAIDKEEQRYLDDSGQITKEEARKVAAIVQKQYPVFKSITVIDGGETWDYDYVASPGETKEGAEKETSEQAAKLKKWDFSLTWPRTAALVTLNGKPVLKGRYYNRGRIHAEQWLVMDLRTRWKEVVRSGIVQEDEEKNLLTIKITRQPCQNCMDDLHDFSHKFRVPYRLEIGSTYGSKVQVRIGLQRLLEAGVEVTPWNLANEARKLIGEDEVSEAEFEELKQKVTPYVENVTAELAKAGHVDPRQ
jgi:hypothetical protein